MIKSVLFHLKGAFVLARSKRWFAALVLLLSAVLVAAGCTGGTKTKSPQEMLQESIEKSAELETYRFSGSLKVEELSFAAAPDDPGMSMVANLLDGAELSLTGVYQADPVHMEMDLALALQGDMAITLNFPIVMTQDKMWIKIPSIPLFPLPDDIAGKKFLEIDMKQMAEMSGQPVPELDPVKSQKFSNDVMNVIFSNIDGDQYLTTVKAADAGVPENAGVKQVIQFKVDKEQVEPFVRTVVEKITPALLDLLAGNAEYREMLGMTPEDIEEARKELADAGGEELDAGLAEFRKAVQTLDVLAYMGINGDGYLVYQDMRLAAEFDADDSNTVKLAIKLISNMTDINKDVTLQYPDGPADIITMEEFESRMGAVFGL